MKLNGILKREKNRVCVVCLKIQYVYLLKKYIKWGVLGG
jgi:hypothetical protein